MRPTFRALLTTATATVTISFGVMASTLVPAASAECTQVLCSGGGALRDDLEESRGWTGYGSSLSLINKERLAATALQGEKEEYLMDVPKNEGDVLLGIDLKENPTSSTTECRKATGWVTYGRILANEAGGNVYSNTSPGYGGAWPISIYSSKSICGSKKGELKIENVGLLSSAAIKEEIAKEFFIKVPGVATGTLSGKYLAGECVEFPKVQSGMTAAYHNSKKETVKLKSYELNGELGKNPQLCLGVTDN